MDVIGDPVARERRSDDLALRTDSRAGSYSYEKFCTNAWKTGNLLRHYGVRDDATVAVDAGDAPAPQPILAFFGTALLGATVRFDPPRDPDARALVVPADRVEEYAPAPGTQVIAYGDVPETPGVAHFEAETWSENPTMPPDVVTPDTVALAAGNRTFTHDRLLSAAASVVDDYGLDADATTALRAPLSLPGTVVAGALAPVLAGGTILLDEEQTGTVAVGPTSETGAERAPEARVADPESVF